MFRRAVLAIVGLPGCLSAQAADVAPLVNQVFAPWDSASTPGCAVGIDRAGAPRYTRAFGRADLEFDLPNKPATIFEAGSISKQFTAAAVVLLARDGKLHLEDDVRKYVPELPNYGTTITIRHLLTHTSGLRDWGEIADLAGWPRGTRVHTHDDVLDILSRQRALNHQPGAQASYTNSGYNLLAIIVSRVSGQSFAQFSRARIFEPLGMRNTQWRDDFRRVIKGRAQAYSTSEGRWYLDMPFENIYGNGGLLTTVDDLLTWTAALEKPTRLWKAVVDSLHVRGRLNNGDTFPYALGLATNEYRGVSWVGHDGATAGYATGLIRFPGKGLAIAVLCNASTASGIDIAFTLADSLLASSLGPPTAPSSDHPASVDSLVWKPNAEELAAFAGTYYSPDVETALNVSVVRDSLVLFRRAARRVVLAPVKSQTFTGFRDRVWFTRDSAGRVVALHVGTSRAFDVVFERR